MSADSNYSTTPTTQTNESDGMYVIAEVLRKLGYSDARNLYFQTMNTGKVRSLLTIIGLKEGSDYTIDKSEEISFIKPINNCHLRINYDEARKIIHNDDWIIRKLVKKISGTKKEDLAFSDKDNKTAKAVCDTLELVGLKRFFDFRVHTSGEQKEIEIIGQKRVHLKLDLDYALQILTNPDCIAATIITR